MPDADPAPAANRSKTRRSPLRCPACGSDAGSKVDRTSKPDTTRTVRYRVCNTCGGRFLTVERVMTDWRSPPAA